MPRECKIYIQLNETDALVSRITLYEDIVLDFEKVVPIAFKDISLHLDFMRVNGKSISLYYSKIDK